MPIRPTHVFVNFPFDPKYEPLYIALVAALTAFGTVPRSVLEIPPDKDRLSRLREIILECEASVHDLSRVERGGKPSVPRFNMPFELGLAIGLHKSSPHSWIVLEKERYRLIHSLSDLNGYDPHIHGNKPEDILRSVTNAFGAKSRQVSQSDLETLWKILRKSARQIKKEQGELFSRAAFQSLVFLGQTLAEKHFANAPKKAPATASRPRRKSARR